MSLRWMLPGIVNEHRPILEPWHIEDPIPTGDFIFPSTPVPVLFVLQREDPPTDGLHRLRTKVFIALLCVLRGSSINASQDLFTRALFASTVQPLSPPP